MTTHRGPLAQPREVVMKKIEVSELQGPLTELMSQIGGANGRQRLHEFNLWLKKVNVQFATWRTVKIGVHKNLGTTTSILTKFKVSNWAKDILGKPAFTLAQVEEDISLCVATVKELTGKNYATTTEIFDAIKLVGDLCPAEVGPALREEQYLDQPNGEWLRVAMEPIKDSGGRLSVFLVARVNDELWLGADYALPTNVWDGSNRFVFRSRK